MKKIFRCTLAVIAINTLLLTFTTGKVIAQAGKNVSVSYQTFYDELTPFGTWIDYPAYGHVWHPAVAGDFRPYLTNGYWVYSAEGWLWKSDYNWGWAAFHYGRWIYDDMYGWLWVPGYEWSPAWVTWGDVDNYYAWAPLMPEVNVGVAFNFWKPTAFYWNICSKNYIYERDIYNRTEKREFLDKYVSRINVINNFNITRLHNQYYCKGPEIGEVERYVSTKIEMASIRDVNSSSKMRLDGHEIKVYRPLVNNPQPGTFRRLRSNIANPVRENGDKIINRSNEQKLNIEGLPVHKTPVEFNRTRQINGRRIRRS